MSKTLYTRDILRLAMMLDDDGDITAMDGHAELRSPICGSMMTVYIRLDDNQCISGVSILAKACAMGQASAAILKKYAIGISHNELKNIRNQVAEYFAGNASMPSNWTELSHLEPAIDYPARQSAILLPYDTCLSAFQNAS